MLFAMHDETKVLEVLSVKQLAIHFMCLSYNTDLLITGFTERVKSELCTL